MNQKNKQVKRKELRGVIVSDKMDKTRVVKVESLKKHPTYQKFFKVTKKFKAHDETNQYHIGDEVVIVESRPISKDKNWTITQKTGFVKDFGKEQLVEEKELEGVLETKKEIIDEIKEE